MNGQLPSPQASLEEKNTARIDAFSDGVFAIVITLLVFNLRVPTLEESSVGGLLSALFRQWPVDLAFITSFCVIGIMWVNHHRMFTYIRRTDDRLLYLNLFLLFNICLVPFPTTLIATYIGHPDQHAAAVIYGLMAFVTAIAFNLLWRHVSSHRELLLPSADQRFIDGITRSYRYGPFLYLFALAMALVNVPLSLLVHLGMALFFARSSGFGGKKEVGP